METKGAIALTLDDAVKVLKIDRADLLRIDVDGNEVNVLKGAHQTLSRFKPAILLELARYVFAIPSEVRSPVARAMDGPRPRHRRRDCSPKSPEGMGPGKSRMTQRSTEVYFLPPCIVAYFHHDGVPVGAARRYERFEPGLSGNDSFKLPNSFVDGGRSAESRGLITRPAIQILGALLLPA